MPSGEYREGCFGAQGDISITFQCSKALAKAMEDEAKARLTSVSSILRMAIESMLRPRLLERDKNDESPTMDLVVVEARSSERACDSEGKSVENVSQQRP